MANLGQLVVNLEANIASFVRDMGKASQSTDQAMKQISGAINTVKGGLATLGVGASAAGVALFIKGAIDAADNLRDMAQKTGIAVEELNGLGFAAGQAGGSLESMVGAAGKLNKAIESAASGNKDTAAAFDALGISVLDASGNLKKADVVMAEVADQFAKYQDGPEKAALALALFGKAGADMIPLLNDGGAAMRDNIEYAKKYSGATTELSNAADNFNDTMGRLTVQQQGFANAVAAQVLPVLQQLAESMLGAAEQSNHFEASSKLIGNSVKILSKTVGNAVFDFKQLGAAVGGVMAINAGMWEGGIAGARRAREQMDLSLAGLAEAQAQFNAGINNGKPTNAIEQFVANYAKKVGEEKTLLGTRLQMLTKYHNDEQLSDKDFYAAKKGAYAEAEQNTKVYYDAQIVALQRWKAEVAKGSMKGDPLAIQGQIDALAAGKSLVGSEKPRAPRLPGKGDDAGGALIKGRTQEIAAAYKQEQDTAAYHEEFMRGLRAQDVVDLNTYTAFKIASNEQRLESAVRSYTAEIAVLETARAAATKDAERAAFDNQIKEKTATREKAIQDAQQARTMQTLGLSAAQADLNKSMKEWGAQQDQSIAQLQFSNGLYGKSALEVTKLTNARRAQLEVEEKIRQAQAQGDISSESIARFKKEADAKANAANAAATKGAGFGIIQSLQTPLETENLEHANKMRDLIAFRDEEAEFTFEAHQAIERETLRHEAAKAELRAQYNLQSVAAAGSVANQLYDLLKQSGEKQSGIAKAAFLVSKAIAVAEIIMQTNVAAAKAKGQLGVFGLPMSAIILATGYAQAATVAGLAIAGAREKGGPVWPGGTFLVGEKGPELFTPSASGTIVPNNALGGKGAGVSVTYAPQIHIDSRTDQAEVHRMVVGAVQQGNADLVDRLTRAGRI